MSPYATGGGGVTFEHQVAAFYLALLLTGDNVPELGPDRHVTRLDFQQAPEISVDDLVVYGSRANEAAPSLRLALAVRRRPNVVRSDQKSRSLIADFIDALGPGLSGSTEQRLGLVVSGTQAHATQLADLARLARAHHDAGSFYRLFSGSKFQKAVVKRLEHLRDLVAEATAARSGDIDVDLTTWRLLRSLEVISRAVEEPESSDRADTRNRLLAVARDHNLTTAAALLDRLEGLASQYALSAATVNASMVRRDAHSLVDSGVQKTSRGWRALGALDSRARSRVRDRVGGQEQPWRLDRRQQVDELLERMDSAPIVLVTGASGVGKSALALAAAARIGDIDGEAGQSVFLNLRQLPDSWLALESHLEATLAELLLLLSAPRRALVVDGAEAAAVGHRDMLAYLVAAASESDTNLVLVTADDAKAVVEEACGDGVSALEVQGLDDEDLAAVVEAFPQLRRLVERPRSRDLLRRLVVVDLLVRSGTTGVPLSEAEAMGQIWAGVVRRDGRRDRGLPEAREHVMLALASRALFGDPVGTLDPAALDGLRRDGLLTAAGPEPWDVTPEFAHDEIRRYAVARVLLASDDIPDVVLQIGAPRWTLSAVTLAIQATLVRDGPKHDLQAAMRGLEATVAAGHGERWNDVPLEALLTLGDPAPVIAAVWPDLRAGDGLPRILRILDQRHRTDKGLLDLVVAGPVLDRLLDEPAPWRISKAATSLIRSALISAVVAECPKGAAFRAQLQKRLLAVAAEAEAERARARSAKQARDANAPPAVHPLLGGRRARRRRRTDLPREVTNETFVELLSLLGVDLGEDGASLLRWIATESPRHLQPALEEPGTARAVADFGAGLLAELVEAYFLEDPDDSYSALDENGIRDHAFGSFSAPLAAWHRGPFWDLFRTDFANGVSVVNRLLNHAARIREKTMSDFAHAATDTAPTGTELSIAGEPRVFHGDEHVWCWYRGTTVGPYPCMSALQALERFCDQALGLQRLSLQTMVEVLLRDCSNLAMPGLVLGMLVRHAEDAGSLLDPFLAEPIVWHLEFRRVTSESSMLAATSDDLHEPERRRWSLREAATGLTVHADEERAQELKRVADDLIERASTMPGDYPVTARAWASALDISTYRAYTEDGVTYMQSTPPAEVVAALAPSNEDLARGRELVGLQWRYFSLLTGRATDHPADDELERDLARGEAFASSPPAATPVDGVDMLAAVSAYAVSRVAAGECTLEVAPRRFALSVLLQIAESVRPPGRGETDRAFFEMGADRLAARVFGALLVPPLAQSAELVGGLSRVTAAGLKLAHAPSMETRLFLARGLDVVWATACSGDGVCHHRHALAWTTESCRDCRLGGWSQGRREVTRLEIPLVEALAAVTDGDLYVERIDAGVRASAAAAASSACCSAEANRLADELLHAQCRGLVARTRDFSVHRGSLVVAARALLSLATRGHSAPLVRHIATFADRSQYLSVLLSGLAVAAQENQRAARVAVELWPSIIDQVLGLREGGHRPFQDHMYGASTLAALAPSATEPQSVPEAEPGPGQSAWPDPLAWEAALDDWIRAAAGEPPCVDAFIALIGKLPLPTQVSFALPRVIRLASPAPHAMAERSYHLSDWLISIRSSAAEAGAAPGWQQLVDSLVVAGDRSLATYSE